MNFYPIYKNKKLLPWIKWWLIKGNKVTPKHLSEWINSAEAITLTGVYKGSPLLYLNLNGNTSQTGTPTPEAPVPVNVVKEDNYININDNTYRVDLGGKNILSISDRTGTNRGIDYTLQNSIFTYSGEATSSYADIGSNEACDIPEGTYTFSIDVARTTGEKIVLYAYVNGSWLSFAINSGNTYTTRTITGKITQWRLGITSMTIGNSYSGTLKIMLEEGSQPTTFSPYVANPIELCKIGDYQDVIYKENNKYYVEKNVGKVVVNGTEDWYYYTATSKPVFYLICEQYNISYKRQSGLLCYSNYFKGNGQVSSFDDVYDLGNNSIAFRISFARLCIRDDRFTVPSDFTTWLSTHNTTVYYVLATSETTEITETNLVSQLEAIYNAKLQSGTNTITQTPSDLPFYLNFQYYEKG